jgi:putative acetyltransferase
MIVREETRGDHAAIRTLKLQAFGGAHEAGLINRLRADELAAVSLVAVDEGGIVGHIMFSTLGVTMDGWMVRSAALAPMAVAPARQRQGIGSALVRRGLEAMIEQGFEAVFVLGHPAYYPRFGFSAALARRLTSAYTGDAFMALELSADALSGDVGYVTYPDAFDPD